MEVAFFQGQITKVTLPSTRVVEIRETNAGDDDLLSNISSIRDSSNVPKFLASIITMDHVLNRKPLVEDVLDYHLNDMWYLMLAQRIINRGSELVFKYKCQNPSCKDKPVKEYVENLKEIDGDLSSPTYTPTPDQIFKYPLGLDRERELRTTSGVLFKYEIMTGIHGKKRLDLSDNEQSRNSMLTLRNLKVKVGDEWQTVTNFSAYPSKVMSEVRADVMKNDREFMPIISGACECETPFAQTLWSMPDFFWPGEEI
jgi:hypothetical protein